ncbi:MAG TPA: hypothetical protein VGJ25_09045 [Gaiellaceae bacterium]|jgi:hypothetical protein
MSTAKPRAKPKPKPKPKPRAKPKPAEIEQSARDLDDASPVDASDETGPAAAGIRVPQSCPSCGRNETFIRSAPSVPEEIEPAHDPATGEPVKAGWTIHVCALCGVVIEVLKHTPKRAVEVLTKRYEKAEADRTAEEREANDGDT